MNECRHWWVDSGARGSMECPCGNTVQRLQTAKFRCIKCGEEKWMLNQLPHNHFHYGSKSTPQVGLMIEENNLYTAFKGW